MKRIWRIVFGISLVFSHYCIKVEVITSKIVCTTSKIKIKFVFVFGLHYLCDCSGGGQRFTVYGSKNNCDCHIAESEDLQIAFINAETNDKKHPSDTILSNFKLQERNLLLINECYESQFNQIIQNHEHEN